MKQNKESKTKLKHICPDGFENQWTPRVDNPVECPRCKGRLDKEKKVS